MLDELLTHDVWWDISATGRKKAVSGLICTAFYFFALFHWVMYLPIINSNTD
jgi:hypothetical protein